MEQHVSTGTLPGLGGYVYEPRPIRFLGVAATGAGWRVKRYTITVAGAESIVPEIATKAAWRAAEAALPLPSDSAAHGGHGTAVLTMHMGLQGFWVLVDWWAHGDILMHRHFRAPVDRPEALCDVSAGGFGPCVWELAVQAHERAAWLRHVLANPAGPDVDAYLRDGLTAVV